MPLHPNNQQLVDALEAEALIDQRYKNLKLVNLNSATGVKRGCFSLVFKADDITLNRPVALKFYEISPGAMADNYRRDAFKRESAILQSLLSKSRCLQLVSEIKAYMLSIPNPLGGPSFSLPCEYFVVDWLDDDIDDYFFDLTPHSAADKLKLFNQIVSAIEALHRNEVFHRDIKADNLRAHGDAVKRLIIAIDLGTAARFDSGYIGGNYGQSVGAPAYAAPEARCGLAGNRKIAPYTDLYAIGCLLYELFNIDYFFRAHQLVNTGFDLQLAAMGNLVTERNDELGQLEQWNSIIRRFGSGVSEVDIRGVGGNSPAGIRDALNSVLKDLTNFDYRKRPIDLASVRAKVSSAIRILENERMYQLRLARVRELRMRRMERARERDAKFKIRQIAGSSSC